MKPCFALVLLGCLGASQSAAAPDFATALAAYRQGDFASAYAGFAAELEARGAQAPVELRIDVAMAALRLTRSSDAAAALAPVVDTPQAPPSVLFLMGMVSLQQAERAATAAALPDAEPMAWQLAVRSARESVRWFGVAAERRGDWDEALRNGERAFRRLQQFEQARDAAKPTTQREAAPKPLPPPPPSQPTTAEEATPELSVVPLTAAEMQQLAQRLQRREQLKQHERRATQRASAVAGERDW